MLFVNHLALGCQNFRINRNVRPQVIKRLQQTSCLSNTSVNIKNQPVAFKMRGMV